MDLTWVTIAASLSMGLGAVFIFVFAVKKDWFRNLEDAKYQVFWSELETLVDTPEESPAAAQSADGMDTESDASRSQPGRPQATWEQRNETESEER